MESPVNQIHPHNAQRLLLLEIVFIQHADMDDDVVDRRTGLGLKAHPIQPCDSS